MMSAFDLYKEARNYINWAADSLSVVALENEHEQAEVAIYINDLEQIIAKIESRMETLT